MTAHQPPTQQTVLVQKQLSHSKLTSITGKCFSTTLNCIWTHRAVADYLLTCVCVYVWKKEVQSVRVRLATSAVFASHVIALILNEYVTLWPRRAPAWQLVSITLPETEPLILVSRRRIICIERGVKWEEGLSSFASSTDGSLLGAFERPGITQRAQTPLSWFDSWNNHQRH